MAYSPEIDSQEYTMQMLCLYMGFVVPEYCTSGKSFSALQFPFGHILCVGETVESLESNQTIGALICTLST